MRIAIVLLLLLCGSAARAVTFVVDVTGDAVDAAPGDGACETAGGLCTLRAAIQEANALSGQQTVELGAGIHSIAIGGADEDAGATGDFDVTDDLVVAGASASATIVDAQTRDRLFDVADGVFLAIRDLTLRDGFVEGANGGGLRAGPDTLVFLARVALEDNVSIGVSCDPFPPCGGAGAALAFEATSTADAPTLLVIQSRLAENLGSGVIHLRNAVAQLVEVTIEDHDVTVLYATGSNVTLDRCSFHGNRSDGNLLYLASDQPTRIENSTISRNFTPSSIVWAPGPLTVRNVTMAENAASYGIHVTGSLQIQNSVISDYLMIDQCHAGSGGSVVSLGHNVDYDGSCTALGSDRTLEDPGLGPLADNGGGTLTHRPLPGSPLIDAAEDADCPDLDQRRRERPQDGDGDGVAHCDIGAVEVPEPLAAGLAAALALATLARPLRRQAG